MGFPLLVNPKTKKILLTQARVFYKEPDGRETSYHVNFIDDAVSALVVFHAVENEITKQDKPSLDDFSVLLIREYRYGDKANVLGLPVGLADTGNVSLVEKALNELAEETGIDSLHNIRADQFSSLGAPFGRHAALTDMLHPFMTQIDMPQQELTDLTAKFTDIQAGNVAEGERIRPIVMPLREAFLTLIREGHEPANLTILSRFMISRGLLNFG